MEILLDGLKKSISTNNGRKVEEESDLFTHNYNNLMKSHSSFREIPKFYSAIPEDEESLPWKIREEARSLFLQNKSESLLNNEELKSLLKRLEQYQCEQIIIFNDLKDFVGSLGAKYKQYLSVLTYAKVLSCDSNDVNISDLFNYIMRKVWIQHSRIGLSLYDYYGLGYLRVSDLENYILDLIPSLTQLNGLQKSFYNFYVATATRKFVFFLDHRRTGKISIRDILYCGFLDDILELRDPDVSLESQESNWFSAPSVLRVYGQYLKMDANHNGMLSKSELATFGSGTLTEAFLSRLFEECLTYDGEMDYHSYLDLVLAIENIQEPQALHYFFKILDVNGQGYLDYFTLNYFFKAVQDQIRDKEQEFVNTDDVINEIFDIVKPKNAMRVTLKDLLNCGQGGLVVSLLIDVNGFWSHENRDPHTSDRLLTK